MDRRLGPDHFGQPGIHPEPSIEANASHPCGDPLHDCGDTKPPQRAPSAIPSRKVYIVLPVLNEAANLRPLIEGLSRVLVNRSYHVILIDDGSTDGTLSVAADLSAAGFPLTVLERGAKLGIGSAIREGLSWCLRKGDAHRIVTMDADLSHDPREITQLLIASELADLVQGSRYVPGGAIAHWGWIRRLQSVTANVLVQILLKTGMKDHTSYFRVYSRAAAEAATADDGSSSYEWALASLLAIRSKNLSIREAPVTFRDRANGSSKMSPGAVILWIRFLLRTRLRSWEASRAATTFPRFAAVGAAGLVVNQAVLVWLHGIGGIPSLMAAASAIETSILFNFLLNDRWTFSGKRLRVASWRRLGNYHMACALGSLAAFAVFALLALGLGIHYLIASPLGVAAGFLINFHGSTVWTWVTD